MEIVFVVGKWKSELWFFASHSACLCDDAQTFLNVVYLCVLVAKAAHTEREKERLSLVICFFFQRNVLFSTIEILNKQRLPFGM